MSDPITVEQVDIDRATQFAWDHVTEDRVTGEWLTTLVQAFARHRLAHSPVPSEATPAMIEAIQMLDNWFAPWGSWKTEWWEDLSGDREYSADTMLEIVRDTLRADQKED